MGRVPHLNGNHLRRGHKGLLRGDAAVLDEAHEGVLTHELSGVQLDRKARSQVLGADGLQVAAGRRKE